jgi:FkbM family methyltransferase
MMRRLRDHLTATSKARYLLWRASRTGRTLSVRMKGADRLLLRPAPSDDLDIAYEVFVSGEYECPQPLDPAAVRLVVDVGANVGYYTLMAAALVGKAGRVFAFEPSPYAFQRLSAALDRNGLSNVRAMQFGLSDRAGEESLFMPDRPGNHTPSMVTNGGGRPIKVPVRRLDECLAEQQVERVDLLKIDVEGFEPNVVEGARGYITRGKVGAILCEFNSHWLRENGSGSEEFYGKLTGLGFRPSKERPNFESLIENVFFTYGS